MAHLVQHRICRQWTSESQVDFLYSNNRISQFTTHGSWHKYTRIHTGAFCILLEIINKTHIAFMSTCVPITARRDALLGPPPAPAHLDPGCSTPTSCAACPVRLAPSLV